MTDARHRLRALAGGAARAPVVATGAAPDRPAATGANADPTVAPSQPSEQRESASAATSAADLWGPIPQHRSTTRHRWGTPVAVAVRLAVAVLVLGAVIVLTILVTRPAAPVHQPEWALPQPALDTDAPAPAPSGQPPEAPPPPAADGGMVVVHIAGAVHDPGVIQVVSSARVHEAIEAAGGATARADLSALNLAAPLVDGEQIYVPEAGEEAHQHSQSGPANPGGAAAGAPVNINSADATTLQTLPGIGPALAERIIAHREVHGRFGTVDELVAVSGIGPATLSQLRDLVTV